MDAITSTRMIQLAQAMQQLPAGETGNVTAPQIEQAREAIASMQSAPAPEPLLVAEPQQIDVRA